MQEIIKLPVSNIQAHPQQGMYVMYVSECTDRILTREYVK